MNKFSVTFPRDYLVTNSKINVIKAIRTLTGLGLKEAKDASETAGPQTFNLAPYLPESVVNSRTLIAAFVESQYNILRFNGCVTEELGQSPGKPDLITGLRSLAIKAIQMEEDIFAGEIINLINSYTRTI